ncbi:uncharacterized protein F4807DRAFT_170533 [Annulohypoxylon truncatum]|uniref:uncharacterized protein n=1 Tax=Annulohypoxylon truncatum TaxID=327061 RepID=UPI002008217C|nr:uncharacterized protein F4807DRAFT_170533 [Annulohypoxylon truncatum]KAI1207922.1 hypothetical protein F4807DRAFT_170533 [Annulohypoxylon truncatum]
MADDQNHIQRELPNFQHPLAARRKSIPRRNTDTRPWEPTLKYDPNNPNKAHRRFSSVLRASPEPIPDPTNLPTSLPTFGEGMGNSQQPGRGFGAEDLNRLNIAGDNDNLSNLSTASVASTSLATGGPSSHGSNGSGRSGITERPFQNGDNIGKAKSRRKRFPQRQPNALNFLDSDSPVLTEESILRSVEEAARRSPTSLQGQSPSIRSASTATTGFRDDASENVGEHETDRSTSPERGVEDGRPNGGPGMTSGPNRKRSYGFPDVPRGNFERPNTPPAERAPRDPNRGRPRPAPAPERLPLTGYELLASKLSISPANQSGPHLRPIFRRFEMLNHRLLLYLQDEICELEEQLRRLDAADTQNRRIPGPDSFFPASRRAEYMAGGELYWHKTDILGKIGFKLEQYNRLLSSCRETQGMPVPSLEDIHEYRSYLATHAPIAEIESRFLDISDDLICVSDEYQEVVEDEPIPTPIPHPGFTMAEPRAVSPIRSRPVSPYQQDRPVSPYRQDRQEGSVITVDTVYDDNQVILLSIAVTVAVILPILTFLIIPGYPGRLTVVILVGLGILGALFQGQIVAIRTWELLTCVGLYGAVMAVIAGIV